MDLNPPPPPVVVEGGLLTLYLFTYLLTYLVSYLVTYLPLPNLPPPRPLPGTVVTRRGTIYTYILCIYSTQKAIQPIYKHILFDILAVGQCFVSAAGCSESMVES